MNRMSDFYGSYSLITGETVFGEAVRPLKSPPPPATVDPSTCGDGGGDQEPTSLLTESNTETLTPVDISPARVPRNSILKRKSSPLGSHHFEHGTDTQEDHHLTEKDSEPDEPAGSRKTKKASKVTFSDAITGKFLFSYSTCACLG